MCGFDSGFDMCNEAEVESKEGYGAGSGMEIERKMIWCVGPRLERIERRQ